MRKIIALGVLCAVSTPLFAFGASKFTVTGWIPYWKKTDGVAETVTHITSFTELSPFNYAVRSDGGIKDLMDWNAEPWPLLVAAARAQRVLLLPSISSGEGDLLHAVLSSSTLRNAHIDNIMALVDANAFDGVDIDYEGKHAATKTYFSRFLKDLSTRLHKEKKLLSCSIEPRTPLSSRTLTGAPATPPQYANDFVAINSACDEVRIMAYDQLRIDAKLDQSKGAKGPYLPVADIDWVKKVLAEAMKTISRKKIVLGIPTYGYEFAITKSPFSFHLVRSLNYQGFIGLEEMLGNPFRNSAGEAGFTYTTSSETRFVSVSDSVAVAKKIALAHQLGLKGVAFFKLDGGNDPLFWNTLQ